MHINTEIVFSFGSEICIEVGVCIYCIFIDIAWLRVKEQDKGSQTYNDSCTCTCSSFEIFFQWETLARFFFTVLISSVHATTFARNTEHVSARLEPIVMSAAVSVSKVSNWLQLSLHLPF